MLMLITARLDPPQPCAVAGPEGGSICGRPATVGSAWPDPAHPRYLLVLPMCRDCVLATARNYDLVKEEESGDVSL